jgi:Ice-binding-like
VGLGTADSFAVLAGEGITNTGPTTITGDIGTFPNPSITGVSDVTLTGTNHADDTRTQGAKTDLVTAYTTAAKEGPTTAMPAVLAGKTLTPGVYNSESAIDLSGVLTLDPGQLGPNAVWVFQAGSTLVTASDRARSSCSTAHPRPATSTGRSAVPRP